MTSILMVRSFINSIMVALLAGGNGNRQTISRRRQRASSIGCVSAGRVLELIEIEGELTGLRQTVIGEARI